MKAIYFNRDQDDENDSLTERDNDEVIYFYSLFLLADKFEFRSGFSKLVKDWQNRLNWSNKFIINFIYEISDNAKNVVSKETMLELNKIFDVTDKNKNKSKTVKTGIAEYRSILAIFRKSVLEWYREVIKDYLKCSNWIDLFDGVVAKASCIQEYDASGNKEDDLLNLLYDEISGNENFILLKDNFPKIIKEINLQDNINTVQTEENKTGYFNIPLLHIPFLANEKKEIMQMLRNNLRPCFQNISDVIEDIKKTVRNEYFDEGLKNTVANFSDKIKPETEKIQNIISQQLHFQQLINSTDNWFNIYLNLGICSINTLVDYYEKSGNLLPFVADSLKKKLALKTDIDKCDAFLFFLYDRNAPEIEVKYIHIK